jgi:hypothetical protein
MTDKTIAVYRRAFFRVDTCPYGIVHIFFFMQSDYHLSDCVQNGRFLSVIPTQNQFREAHEMLLNSTFYLFINKKGPLVRASLASKKRADVSDDYRRKWQAQA